jgi:hypothetical protein
LAGAEDASTGSTGSGARVLALPLILQQAGYFSFHNQAEQIGKDANPGDKFWGKITLFQSP